MKINKEIINKLPKYTKNFYFIFGAIFLFWMLFLDSNDLITQYKQYKKLKDLEDEKLYYLEKIDEVKKDREELLSNKELLEKFAREKYLMKKKTEDLYVIVEED
jgi:cell division protein DivIC